MDINNKTKNLTGFYTFLDIIDERMSKKADDDYAMVERYQNLNDDDLLTAYDTAIDAAEAVALRVLTNIDTDNVKTKSKTKEKWLDESPLMTIFVEDYVLPVFFVEAELAQRNLIKEATEELDLLDLSNSIDYIHYKSYVFRFLDLTEWTVNGELQDMDTIKDMFVASLLDSSEEDEDEDDDSTEDNAYIADLLAKYLA